MGMLFVSSVLKSENSCQALIYRFTYIELFSTIHLCTYIEIYDFLPECMFVHMRNELETRMQMEELFLLLYHD